VIDREQTIALAEKHGIVVVGRADAKGERSVQKSPM